MEKPMSVPTPQSPVTSIPQIEFEMNPISTIKVNEMDIKLVKLITIKLLNFYYNVWFNAH